MQNTKIFFRKIRLSKSVLLFIIVTIILLYPLFLYPFSYTFPQSDVNMYSAWKSFLIDNFKVYGHIPLWNPYLFSGAPFLGNSQVGLFYPMNIFYFLLPIDRAFSFVFLLDYILIGLFSYGYARLIGLGKYGALVSAISMTFNGAIMKQLFLGHIIIMDSLAWFPLLLYFYEKILKKRLIVFGVFSGTLLGIMFLAGNVQIPLYAFFAASIYFFIRVFQEYKITSLAIKRVIFFPTTIFIIGLSLFAIQLIPTFEFSQLSARNQGVDYLFASDFSFHPKQLPAIIFPSLFGSDINNSYWGVGSFWSSSIYTGILPFFLALIALIYKRNKYTYALFAILLFSLLFAFGRYGPFFGFFYDHVPLFNNFRVPTRFLFVYAFSLSIFSGLGMEYIFDKLKLKQYSFLNKFKIAAFLCFSGAIFMYALLHLGKNNIELFEKLVLKNSYAQGINHNSIYSLIMYDVLFFCVVSLLLFILLYLAVLKKLSPRILYFFLILLILTDFFIFYSKFYRKAQSETTYDLSKEISFLRKDKSRFRIFPISGIQNDITSKYKLESTAGFDPLYLALYRDFLWKIGPYAPSPYESFITIERIDSLDNLRLLNVKYILSQKNLEINNLSKVFEGEYKIYKIQDTLPRAFVHFENNPNFSPENTKPFKEVFIEKYEPDKIKLKTKLDKPGYLFLSEQNYPGWEAYDNNELVTIHAANKVFRSIYLEKGNHQIVFRYNPQSYKIGKLITIIALFLVFSYLIFFSQKKLISIKS